MERMQLSIERLSDRIAALESSSTPSANKSASPTPKKVGKTDV